MFSIGRWHIFHSFSISSSFIELGEFQTQRCFPSFVSVYHSDCCANLLPLKWCQIITWGEEKPVENLKAKHFAPMFVIKTLRIIFRFRRWFEGLEGSNHIKIFYKEVFIMPQPLCHKSFELLPVFQRTPPFSNLHCGKLCFSAHRPFSSESGSPEDLRNSLLSFALSRNLPENSTFWTIFKAKG